MESNKRNVNRTFVFVNNLFICYLLKNPKKRKGLYRHKSLPVTHEVGSSCSSSTLWTLGFPSDFTDSPCSPYRRPNPTVVAYTFGSLKDHGISYSTTVATEVSFFSWPRNTPLSVVIRCYDMTYIGSFFGFRCSHCNTAGSYWDLSGFCFRVSWWSWESPYRSWSTKSYLEL